MAASCSCSSVPFPVRKSLILLRLLILSRRMCFHHIRLFMSRSFILLQFELLSCDFDFLLVADKLAFVIADFDAVLPLAVFVKAAL